jgi:hypothetical protein
MLPSSGGRGTETTFTWEDQAGERLARGTTDQAPPGGRH